MTTDQPDIPTGFNVEYSYHDPDDMTRRRDTADYVAEPLTKEVIEQRRREREERGDE